MSAFRELLAALATEEALDETLSGRLTEAYEFDTADFTEQLTASQTAEGEANTNIATLTEQVAKLEADIVAVKAMNFDKLVNGDATSAVGDNDKSDVEDPLEDPELTLDELIELQTKDKE